MGVGWLCSFGVFLWFVSRVFVRSPQVRHPSTAPPTSGERAHDMETEEDETRTIRIPIYMVETINKLVRVQRQLLNDLGREPTPE
jgi:hypothetical protein